MTYHTIAVQSSEPLLNTVESVPTAAIEFTTAVCSVNLLVRTPLFESHNETVLSAEHDNIVFEVNQST